MSKVAERVKQIESRAAARAAEADALDAATAEVAGKRRELVSLAETVLRRRAETWDATESSWAPRLLFGTEELAIFDSLAWSSERLRQELARMWSIVHWERRAGTAESRQEAESAHLAAEAELTARGPGLQEKRAAVDRELGGLTRAVRDAELRIQESRSAIEALKKLAAPEVMEEHTRQSMALGPMRAELAEAVTDVQRIQAIAAVDLRDPSGRREAHQIAETYGRHDLLRRPGDNPSYIDDAGWTRFVADKKTSLPALASRISEVESQILERQSAIDSLLSAHIA